MYLCLIGLNVYYLPKHQRSRKGKTKLSSISEDFIIFLMVQFLEEGKKERSEREERDRKTEQSINLSHSDLLFPRCQDI